MKGGEGLPYADGATAQTRADEAAKVGVGTIKTYPALRLVLLLLVGVGVGVLCHSVEVYARVVCV